MRKLADVDSRAARALIRTAGRTCAEQRLLHRLHCVLLVGEGRSCYEVARWFGDSPRTVERWVQAFRRGGMEGLRERCTGGRPAMLSSQELRSLADDLRKPPSLPGRPHERWNGTLLREHVASRFGVTMSTRQCQRIMRRLTRGQPV